MARVGGFEACLSIDAAVVQEKFGLPGATSMDPNALDVAERYEKPGSKSLLDAVSTCHNVALGDTLAQITVDLAQFCVSLGECFAHLLVRCFRST